MSAFSTALAHSGRQKLRVSHPVFVTALGLRRPSVSPSSMNKNNQEKCVPPSPPGTLQPTLGPPCFHPMWRDRAHSMAAHTSSMSVDMPRLQFSSVSLREPQDLSCGVAQKGLKLSWSRVGLAEPCLHGPAQGPGPCDSSPLLIITLSSEFCSQEQSTGHSQSTVSLTITRCGSFPALWALRLCC